MFALSAATGKPIWVDQDLLGNGQGTFGIQPLVANGRVYLAGSIGTVPTGGILLALNAATGKLVWTPCTILPGSLGGVLSNLALAGNTVYVATVSNDLVFTTLYTGVLTALDRATGAIVYQRTLPTSANASIAIAGNSVLVPRAGLAFRAEGRLASAGGLHGPLTDRIDKDVSMLYIVIERYLSGPGPVYERAAARGRMLPEGLVYVNSWVVADGGMDRCFQLMETSDPALFDVWFERWSDLVSFAVYPVITSAEAAERHS